MVQDDSVPEQLEEISSMEARRDRLQQEVRDVLLVRLFFVFFGY